MSRAGAGIGALIVAAAVLASTACVRRTLTINTDPQGASVTLNDEQIGTSPVSRDFTWYGDYDVIIKKEGYETLSTHKKINPPWYQVPGIDFFAEALMPFTIHDRQQMSFALEPAKPIDKGELIEGAKQFREKTLFEGETGARK